VLRSVTARREELSTETTSPAKLLELIRSKLSRVVLNNVVREKIDSLKNKKIARGQLEPDTEHRTIFHGDLEHAIRVGSIVDHCQVTYALDWWTCTVRGIDRGGEQLVVVVEISESPAEPLVITDFSIDQA